jgi:hypothetical protein
MRKLNFLDKGTAPGLDEADRTRLETALNARFQSFLQDEKLSLECGYSAEQAQMRVTLDRRDGTYAYPVETAVVAAEGQVFDRRPLEAIEALVCFQEAYWESYLQDGREVYLTLDWSQHQVNGHTVFARGFERNPDLIAQADAILREGGFGEYQIESISSET